MAEVAFLEAAVDFSYSFGFGWAPSVDGFCFFHCVLCFIFTNVVVVLFSSKFLWVFVGTWFGICELCMVVVFLSGGWFCYNFAVVIYFIN